MTLPPYRVFAAVAAVLCLLVVMEGRAPAQSAEPGQAPRPNIIYILADDLGYGELGSYGQRVIQTPELDRMAEQGMRFTQHYAGSTVCAPARSVLLTGQHTGRTPIRGNLVEPRNALTSEPPTIAGMLRDAGYATACIGKWGVGSPAALTNPNDVGFDHFFGYLNMFHAHNYYPEFLIRNGEVVELRNVSGPKWRKYRNLDNPRAGMGVAEKKVDYTPDLFLAEARQFIRQHRDEPFFLYFSMILPHANNEAMRQEGDGTEIPDYGIYADRDWPDQDKGHAAMITRMDRDVGELLALLRELEIDERTLVIFTSDNGPHNESRHNLGRFNPSGNLRGIKRDLYEGGIRVPFIARWPGRIAPGTSSGHISYFGDMMATFADLAGTRVPEGDRQSISMLPALLGDDDEQAEHDYLYWEFHERRTAQAVRQGPWKAVRVPAATGDIELYNLEGDLGEQNNIAADHPDIARRMERIMEDAHMPTNHWSFE